MKNCCLILLSLLSLHLTSTRCIAQQSVPSVTAIASIIGSLETPTHHWFDDAIRDILPNGGISLLDFPSLSSQQKPVLTITNAPPYHRLIVGGSHVLGSTLVSSDGDQIHDHPVAWRSSDPSKLFISRTGRIRGISEGFVTITAATVYGNETIVSSNDVPIVVVASIAIPSLSAQLRIQGGHRTLSINSPPFSLITAYTDDSGQLVTQPYTVMWISSNPDVATINADGLVTILSVGQTEIVAQTGDLQSQAIRITVEGIPLLQVDASSLPDHPINSGGGSHAVRATFLDQTGAENTNVEVRWSSSATDVATVDRGIITPISAGITQITASVRYLGNQYSTSPITVEVITFMLSGLPSGVIEIGQDHQLETVFIDENGRAPSTPPAVVWVSDAPEVLSVAQGNLTARTSGTAQVTATINYSETTYSVSAQIRVVNPGGASATILPIAQNKINKDTQASGITLTYTAEDEDGNGPTGLTWEWSSSDPTKLAVDPSTGALTPTEAGVGSTVTITLQAKRNNVVQSDYTSTYNILIVQTPIALITNLPTNAQIHVNDAGYTLGLSIEDEHGVEDSGWSLRWTSSDASKLAVNTNTGELSPQASGIGGGTVTITVTATKDGESNLVRAAQITVVQTPMAEITPIAQNKINKDTQSSGVTLTYIAEDEHGASPTGLAWEWSSSDATKLAINASTGELTPKDAGVGSTITITLSGNQNGVPISNYLTTYDLRVVQTPAGQITNIPTGRAIDLDAVDHRLGFIIEDENGNTDTGWTLRWSTSDATKLGVGATTGTLIPQADWTDATAVTITVTAQKEGSSDLTATVDISANPPRVAPTFRISSDPGFQLVLAQDPSAAKPTTTLSTIFTDETNQQVNPTSITWTSTAPEVATVDASSGLITAVAKGTTLIEAVPVYGGQTMTDLKSGYQITVVQPVLEITNTIRTTSPLGYLNGSFRLLNGSGTEALSVPNSAVEWSTANAGVLRLINAQRGIFRGVTIGSTQISVTVQYRDQSFTSSVDVEVEAGPVLTIQMDGNAVTGAVSIFESQPVTVRFTLKDTDDSDVSPLQIDWALGVSSRGEDLRSADDDLLSIQPSSDGLSAMITGLKSAQSADAFVSVSYNQNQPFVIARIEFEIRPGYEIVFSGIPTNHKLLHTDTAQRLMVSYTRAGSAVTLPMGSVLSWESSNSNALAVSSLGELTPSIDGIGETVTITGKVVHQGEVIAINALEIRVVTVPSSTIEAPATIQIGDDIKINKDTQSSGIQLSYQARDENNDRTTGVDFQWSSSDSDQLAIASSTGELTPKDAGVGSTVTITLSGRQNNILQTDYTSTVDIDVIQTPWSSITPIAQNKINKDTQSSGVSLTYTAEDENGATPTGLTWEWSSSDATNLAIHATTGALTPTDAGVGSTVTITLQAKRNTLVQADYTSTYDLLVVQNPIALITNLPTDNKIHESDTGHILGFSVENENGVADSGWSLSWASGDGNKLAVDADTGELSPQAGGVGGGAVTITVTATKDGESNLVRTAQITVVQTPTASINPIAENKINKDTQSSGVTLTYTAEDENGASPTGLTWEWSSSDATKLAINATTGALTPTDAGVGSTVTITLQATLNTVVQADYTSTYDLLVVQTPIALITNLPTDNKIHESVTGHILGFSVENENGVADSGWSLSWASSDASKLAVNADTGELSPQSGGVGGGAVTITVTATKDGESNLVTTAQITVVQTPTASINAIAENKINKDTQSSGVMLTYTAEDENGATPTGLTWEWSSSDATNLAIHATAGALTPTDAGVGSTVTITLQAKRNNVVQADYTSTYDILIVQTPITHITNLPTDNKIHESDTGHILGFSVENENGVADSGWSLSWASSDASKLAVNATSGELSPQSGGVGGGAVTITVTATKDGESNLVTTAQITVVQTPTASINAIAENKINKDTQSSGVTLTYTAEDENGASPTGLTWEWSSSDAAKLAIDASTGDLTPTAVGVGSTVTITLQATLNTVVQDNYTSTYDILVVQSAIARINNIPTNNEIHIDTNDHSLSSTVEDEQGSQPTGLTRRWISSDPSKLAIDATSGLLSPLDAGIGGGAVTITLEGRINDVVNDDYSSTVEITVVQTPFSTIVVPAAITGGEINKDTQASGITLTFSAEDKNGATPTGLTWEWSSSVEDQLLIDATSGALTPQEPSLGSDVTLTLMAKESDDVIADYTSSVALKVVQNPIRQIGNLPTNNKINVNTSGHTLTFNIEDRDGNDLGMDNTWTWAWTSSSSSSLTVNASTGELTPQEAGVGQGAVTITLTGTKAGESDITATAMITVVQTPFSRIVVPDAISGGEINIDTQSSGIILTYEAEDENGNPVSGLTWTWSSTRSSELSVNPNTGELTPHSTNPQNSNKINIIATVSKDGQPAPSFRRFFGLFVVQNPIQRITNLPTGGNLNITDTDRVLGFEVESKFGLDLTERFNGWIWSWSSSDATKLDISSTGKLIPKQAGLGGGPVTIKARGTSRTPPAIEITTDITVVQDVMVDVVITPAPLNGTEILLGRPSGHYSVTVTIADENAMTVSVTAADVSWTSSNTNHLDISNAKKLIPKEAGVGKKVTLTGTYSTGGKTYTGSKEFTIGRGYSVEIIAPDGAQNNQIVSPYGPARQWDFNYRVQAPDGTWGAINAGLTNVSWNFAPQVSRLYVYWSDTPEGQSQLGTSQTGILRLAFTGGLKGEGFSIILTGTTADGVVREVVYPFTFVCNDTSGHTLSCNTPR